ncbi:MAG: hypothetical protein GY869_32060, partial [Planctomycetes bacterium]|nr:hypothetical protein [Planctomycetota bacterium]
MNKSKNRKSDKHEPGLLPDETPRNVKFGFKNYAETIASLISDSDTGTPLTIAIHGDWGTGKTTLMHEIVSQLKNKKKFEVLSKKVGRNLLKPKIIWFSAWEFQTEDEAWILFMNYVLNKLKDDLPKEPMFKVGKSLLHDY